MNEVYIDMRNQNEWISKYFEGKDYASIDDLLACIEDLDIEIDNWKYKYKELENDMKENYEYIGSKPDWHDIQEHEPSWWVG